MNKDQNDDFRSFDMYRFFSRKDVIAAILLIVLLLLFVAYKVISAPVVA